MVYHPGDDDVSDRGQEIERFFWLLLRLAALAFGCLLMLAGALFALSVTVEWLRTGAIALNGTLYDGGPALWWIIATPVAVFLVGGLLVRWSRHDRQSLKRSPEA